MLDEPSEYSAMNQIHDSGAHLLIISVVFRSLLIAKSYITMIRSTTVMISGISELIKEIDVP